MADQREHFGEPSEDPHCFIQWKGTDVCMDFHCECGHHSHFDCQFAYAIKCPKCGQVWEMPSNLYPRKVAGQWRGCAPKTTELEEDD